MRAAALLPGLLVCALAAAQDYPAKPVRLIVGFPPGGNVDVVGRIVAQKMGEGLGQQVVPENRTGAGSIIANEYVAKSAADGYTLLVVSGAFVTQAATMKKLPYDPLRDFSFISTIVTYPLVFSVRSDSRFRTLGEFIAFVKSNPGKINYPSPGMGTLYHLAGEMFVSMAGIEMQHVPFRGGSEPLTEVLSGRMELLIDALTNSYPQIQAGKFRPLAVSSVERSSALPEVPAVADSVPGYEATSFIGLAGPAGMPAAVVDRLNSEARRILALSDVGRRFAEWGGTPSASSPEEMKRHVGAEIEKWKRVVAARKLELQ
ncbi:MAG: tripartite tricarboxylate transporter substrate binding protein [Betaproteobacteria bacterium]|nr:MAG: tripartite tricarboxylate transporter substrate binding protein [Betaproteobacteria bacterium]TMH91772.1 MAG: tripartite tricarboxylate transporter substrate binding protein [Betaproteobacteria bacterium]